MKVLRFFIPVIVVAACAGIAYYLIANRPVPERRPPRKAVSLVDAVRLKPVDYPVTIRTQGLVRPRTTSTLIPEVAGKVVSISPDFREGGFFGEGDVLVTIDDSDYEAAVVVAEATLAQKRALLEVEKAQSQQALENWKTLGNREEPSPLVLRIPQWEEAKAAVASAEASLARARRDYDRTRIVAPYTGRILTQRVDVAQYVTTGTILATIYAVDYAEVRLPLSNQQLGFLDLPEQFRGDPVDRPDGPRVVLSARVGRKEGRWEGRLVRTEGTIDTASHQLFVVAHVDDPYQRQGGERPPLRIGQFVEAEISGEVLQGVFVIPRSAVRLGNEILIIDEQNRLQRREITPLWSDGEAVVVREGLTAGEVLCLTSLPFAANGASVVPDIEGEGRRGGEGNPKPKPGG